MHAVFQTKVCTLTAVWASHQRTQWSSPAEKKLPRSTQARLSTAPPLPATVASGCCWSVRRYVMRQEACFDIIFLLKLTFVGVGASIPFFRLVRFPCGASAISSTLDSGGQAVHHTIAAHLCSRLRRCDPKSHYTQDGQSAGQPRQKPWICVLYTQTYYR